MTTVAYSQTDNNSQKNNLINQSGYDTFVKSLIGTNVAVIIAHVDITISGTLIDVYQDGILLQTVFKDKVFIPRESIAYIKNSNIKKK